MDTKPSSTSTPGSKGHALLQKLKALWERIASNRKALPILVAAGFVLSILTPRFKLVDEYVQLILIYIMINIILTASLNLPPYLHRWFCRKI